MREKEEYDYLLDIYYSNDLNKGGYFSDYERACSVSEKNHGFRIWLKKLIEEGILNSIENNDIQRYIPNKGLIRKKIQEFKKYPKMRKLHNDIYEGILRH